MIARLRAIVMAVVNRARGRGSGEADPTPTGAFAAEEARLAAFMRGEPVERERKKRLFKRSKDAGPGAGAARRGREGRAPMPGAGTGARSAPHRGGGTRGARPKDATAPPEGGDGPLGGVGRKKAKESEEERFRRFLERGDEG